MATVRILRPQSDAQFPAVFASTTEYLEFVFVFVLEGQVTLSLDSPGPGSSRSSDSLGSEAVCSGSGDGSFSQELSEASSVALPASAKYQFAAQSPHCKLLLVEVRQQEE